MDNQEQIKIDLDKKKERSRVDLTPKERFLVDTLEITTEITKKLEELGYCFAFLNSYPKTPLWEKAFTRSDYVRYHLCIYYTNVIGLFDRCLLLVNHLYDLGLEPQDVKFGIIVSNAHVKDEKVAKILKELNRGLQNIRSLRNFIAHRGTLSDKKLDEVGRYEFILRANPKGFDKDTRKMIEFFKIKFELRYYLKSKKKEVEKNNAVLISIVDSIFTSLDNQYKKMAK